MLSALTLGATHGALMTDYDINGTNIWSGKFVYIIQLSRKLSSSRNQPIGLVTSPMSYLKKKGMVFYHQDLHASLVEFL